MSAIVELQERIQDTTARIAEYEKAALQPNAPRSLFYGIRSLEKLRTELEGDFVRLARTEELEVCRYRLLPRQGVRPAMSAVAKAWTQYQELFSSVYEAIIHGPKARTSKRVARQTQFGFAYTFSGSIGVVLTLPIGQLNYESSVALDRARSTVFEMAKSQTPEGLAAFTERLGVAPVSKLSHWVNAHIDFPAGAAVEWEISSGAKPELLLQMQEFEVIKRAMDTISEPVERDEPVSGKLVAANMRRRTFEMMLDNGEPIAGKFTDAITDAHKATLPQRYNVLLRKTTTFKPSREEIKVKYFLMEIIRDLA